MQVGMQGDQHWRSQGMETEDFGGLHHHTDLHSASLRVDAACWGVQQQVWTRIQRSGLWAGWWWAGS